MGVEVDPSGARHVILELGRVHHGLLLIESNAGDEHAGVLRSRTIRAFSSLQENITGG
jgi:hypothetical protein